MKTMQWVKRAAALSAALVLVLGMVGAVSAVPVTNLMALAAHFPAEAPFFVSARTDSEFIEALDGVVAQINTLIPAPSEPLPSLSDALDMLSAPTGGTFEEVFGSWLGATIAVGFSDFSTLGNTAFSETPPVILAAEVSDRAGAEAYLEEGLGFSDTHVREEGDGFTLYIPLNRRADAPFAIVRDDALIVTATGSGLIANGAMPEQSLLENAAFVDTFAQLPESSYNVAIYIDLQAFIEATASDLFEGDSNPLEQLSELSQTTVMGATVLNDRRSLTIDIVQTLNADAYAELGITVAEYPALSDTIVSRVPAGAPLVLVASGLGQLIETQIASLAPALEAQGIDPSELGLEDAAQDAATAIEQLTGLDIETELLPALRDSSFALWLGLSESAADANNIFGLIAAFPVDFGLVIEMNDPLVAIQLVDGIADAIESDIADNPQITIVRAGGPGATLATVTFVASRDLPFPIAITLVADNGVVTLGTDLARAAAAGEVPGLDSDPKWQQEAALFLVPTVQVAYLSGEGLLPLARIIATIDDSIETLSAANAMEFAFRLFDSSQVSGSIGTELNRVRMTITLPE